MVEWEGRYYTRPFPKSVYPQVKALVDDNRWSQPVRVLCEPEWPTPEKEEWQ